LPSAAVRTRESDFLSAPFGHGTPQLTLAGALGAAPSSHARATLAGASAEWAGVNERQEMANKRREAGCFMEGGKGVPRMGCLRLD
jgi:hypothetical protein